MPDAATSPYQAPTTPLESAGTCYREGDLLVVTPGATLPPFCVLSGLPLDPAKSAPQPIYLRWTPPWIYATALLGVFPMFLLMALWSQRAVIHGYLSPATAKRVRMRKWNAIAAFTGGVALVIAALVNRELFMLGVTGFMLLLYSIVAFVMRSALHPAGYRQGAFLISGRPLRFLKALPAAPGGEG